MLYGRHVKNKELAQLSFCLDYFLEAVGKLVLDGAKVGCVTPLRIFHDTA